MKTTKTLSNIFVYLMILTIMACSVYAAQTAVNLGTAGNFIILSESGISTTGTTAIVGNIGVSPIDQTAITGFSEIIDSSGTFSTSSLVTGKIYAADYTSPTPTVMTTAVSDMHTAYTDAAGRTDIAGVTELGAGNIDSMTLAPGLYTWGTNLNIPNGVTLTGNTNDVWIFQIAQDLIVGNGAIVTLAGNAQPKNIFWQVAGQTTLGTTSDFKGTILDQTAVVIMTGATLSGRALAQTAVTLDANSVSMPVPILTSIIVTPSTATINSSSTQQLNATSFDQFNSTMAATITYTTSNSSVASVDSSGLVTAVASGNAIITAASGSVNDTSDITVLSQTAAPILNNIGARSITQGTLLNFTITATSPDGFNLTYSISGQSIAATFTDNADGTATFDWTPVLGDVGTTNVNFTVSDGINSDSEVVALTVNSMQAPTTAPTNTVIAGNVWGNTSYNITLNATGANSTPIDYINYTLNGVPGQITGSSGDVLINVNGNNTLTYYAVDTLGNMESTNTVQAMFDNVAPNITVFNLSAISVNTGDAITSTCVQTDNLDVNTVVVVTGIDTSSAGTKTATCTATDAAGNIATALTTYSVNAVSSGGSSGGGGGGGGGGNYNYVGRNTKATLASGSSDQLQSSQTNFAPAGYGSGNSQVELTAFETANANGIQNIDATNTNDAATSGNLLTGGVVVQDGAQPSWWTSFMAWIASLFGY